MTPNHIKGYDSFPFINRGKSSFFVSRYDLAPYCFQFQICQWRGENKEMKRLSCYFDSL